MSVAQRTLIAQEIYRYTGEFVLVGVRYGLYATDKLTAEEYDRFKRLFVQTTTVYQLETEGKAAYYATLPEGVRAVDSVVAALQGMTPVEVDQLVKLQTSTYFLPMQLVLHSTIDSYADGVLAGKFPAKVNRKK